MNEKFIKVSSLSSKIISLLTVIAGCILMAVPFGTVAALAGVLLFITGIVLVFVLKGCYKYINTGEVFQKKELYFDESRREQLADAVKNAPEKIDIVNVGNGDALRLDVYYSRKHGKAFIQLFRYVPYQYEPCSEMTECQYSKIEKIMKLF